MPFYCLILRGIVDKEVLFRYEGLKLKSKKWETKLLLASVNFRPRGGYFHETFHQKSRKQMHLMAFFHFLDFYSV